MSIELSSKDVQKNTSENLEQIEKIKMLQMENEAQPHRKKKLQRLRSTFSEESFDIVQSDGSQDSYQSGESPIFPSPVAITREEAMFETCHVQKQNGRHFSNIEEAYGAEENTLYTNGRPSSGEGGIEYGKASPHHNGMRGSQIPRRETEKPPRLQKQSSRDRIPSGGPQINNNNNGVEVNGCNGVMTSSKSNSSGCLDSMGVDVHEFLVKSLKSNTRDRNILLKLEHDMMKFVNNQSITFMRFPPMTSYHRMLVHRVAAYFGMDHNIDVKGTAVIINKTKKTRMPEGKFADYVLECDDLGSSKDEDIRRRSILKRMKNCQSLDHTNIQIRANESWRDAKQRSFEEREVDYEKIRARIFSDHDSPRSRNVRSREKERIMNQWQQRPWNSTDLGSLPGRSSSGGGNPPVSILSSSNLTDKSNSFSGITVLSRKQNNLSTESFSNASSNSSPSVFKQNDPLQNNKDNWGNPQEQHPRLVPYLGFPYVTLDGQPVLYPGGKPLMVPSYPQVPMQYMMGQNGASPSPYNTQPQMANQANTNNYEQAAPTTTQTPVSSGVNNMTHPPQMYQQINPSKPHYPSFQAPYQPAPVQLVYYPTGPMQTTQYGNSQNYNQNIQPNNLTTRVENLNINKPTEKVKQENVNEKNIEQPQENPNNETAKSSEKVEAIVNVPNNKQETQQQLKEDTVNIVVSQNQNNITEAPKLLNGDIPNNTSPGYTSTETVLPNAATLPHSTTYYPPQNIKPYPLQTGVTGHPVVAPTQLHPSPMYNGPHYQVGPDGKVHKPMSEIQDQYYYSQGTINGYNVSAPQPTYYIIAQNPNPYQYTNTLTHAVPYSNPVMYPHYPNHVAPQYQYQTYDQPSSTMVLPTENPSHTMVVPNNVNVTNLTESSKAPLHHLADDFFPVLVEGVSDMDNVELNTFAAKHEAKLMQVESENENQQNSPASHDLYLLFTTKVAATTAVASHKGESPFKLTMLTDSEAITKLANRAYPTN